MFNAMSHLSPDVDYRSFYHGNSTKFRQAWQPYKVQTVTRWFNASSFAWYVCGVLISSHNCFVGVFLQNIIGCFTFPYID